MTDQYNEPKATVNLLESDPSCRVDAVKRVLAKLHEIDPSNIEGLVIAIKTHSDGEGSPDFELGSMGSVELLTGLLENTLRSFEENVPGFKEALQARALDELMEAAAEMGGKSK